MYNLKSILKNQIYISIFSNIFTKGFPLIIETNRIYTKAKFLHKPRLDIHSLSKPETEKRG